MLLLFLDVVLVAAALLAVDYYVYRSLCRYAQYRRWARRWALPVYRVLMFTVPVTLPIYFGFVRWWQETPVGRTLFITLLGLYYVPKLIVAVGVLVKDLLHFSIWLFTWFQEQLEPPPPLATADALPLRGAELPTPALQPVPTALDLTDMKRMQRRTFLREMGSGPAQAPLVLVGYEAFKRLYDFEVHEVSIPLQGLPRALDGLRIVQLSDLHAGSFFSTRPMIEAVGIVDELKPDLVTITGDFVNGDAAELKMIVPGLRRLSAPLGVYGCLGNHDHYGSVREVADGVGRTPVDLLVNEHRTLEIDGARLHVIGTDNTGYHQDFADLPAAMDGLDREDDEAAFLLLAHDPTFWDLHVRPQHPEIDLMLCGHTHGGQLGIESGRVRWSFISMAYERWAGLYAETRRERDDAQYLYVNRGLGTVGPPLRLGIRPEITVLTLHRP